MIRQSFLPLLFSSSFFLLVILSSISLFFFFNDTATTEIYTLSLHDALPILAGQHLTAPIEAIAATPTGGGYWLVGVRSEEHTSELQSHLNLVCRLLLEKKKKKQSEYTQTQLLNSSHHATESTLYRLPAVRLT